MVLNPFGYNYSTDAQVREARRRRRHGPDVKPPRLAISKKPAVGVTWRCPRCALTYPAWTTAMNTFLKSDQCFDANDPKVKGGGCPACLRKGRAPPHVVAGAFRSQVIGDFDAKTFTDPNRFDPAHPPKLKPNEYAVTFQFRENTQQGKVLFTPKGNLLSEIRQREPVWEDRPPEGYVVRDYASLMNVKRKLFFEYTIFDGNALRSSTTGRKVLTNEGEAKAGRKWLKVVDHEGTHGKLSDLDALFPAPKPQLLSPLYTTQPKIFAPSVHGHLEETPRELEPITEEILREVWRVMIPDAVLDEDPKHALIGLTPGCLKRLDAFNERREAIRKDGGGDTVTRLFHGTCAHRIRLIMRHGLERSSVTGGSALGPGIYFGLLPKARGFASACGEPHYLEGYAEGERIGRMYSKTVSQLTNPTVRKKLDDGTWVDAPDPDIVDPMQAALTFVLLKTIEHYPDLDLSTKTKRGTTRTFNNVASRLTPSEKRRFNRLAIWQRVRFVLEVDVLLGKSYELDGDWERSENNKIPSRVLRRGHHSVHCARFKQDEWAVYRPDQCLLRGIRALVDDEVPK